MLPQNLGPRNARNRSACMPFGPWPPVNHFGVLSSTTTTRSNVPGARQVPGGLGGGRRRPGGPIRGRGGEYGCGTECTSYAVIRCGVALGERQRPECTASGRKRAAPL